MESELLPRLNSSPVATTRLRIAHGLYQLVCIAEDHSGLGHMRCGATRERFLTTWSTPRVARSATLRAPRAAIRAPVAISTPFLVV